MATETRSLHKKLAQVMYEAERIPKNGTAPREMGGYQFVQVGDAADFIRKALAEKVVTMMPTAVHVVAQNEHATLKGGTMTTVDLITEWTLTDGESGESITIMSYGAGSDTGDKYSGKASTSAMKYALLTGFLLSTGEDSEGGTLPERKTTGGFVNDKPFGQPDRPELDRPANGLIGEVQIGKPPVDMQVRQTPEGPAYGFKLKAGNKGYQALAVGPFAEALSIAGLTVGERVTVDGSVVMVPWDKDGKPMPPFARIALSRVSTSEWVLPALSVDGSDDISEAEAAEIVARELAEATT